MIGDRDRRRPRGRRRRSSVEKKLRIVGKIDEAGARVRYWLHSMVCLWGSWSLSLRLSREAGMLPMASLDFSHHGVLGVDDMSGGQTVWLDGGPGWARGQAGPVPSVPDAGG